MPKSPTPIILFDKLDVTLPPEAFPRGYVPARALLAARRYLSLFVIRQATQTSERVGFSWVGQEDAPDTYDKLHAAFAAAAATGNPLPISNQHCANTIYPAIEANLAARFWHDVNHVEQQRDFNHVQEIDLALWHLDVAAADGLPRWSVAWRLLEADLLGQTLCAAVLGRFPVNQYVFDVNCLHFGISDAVVMESEQDFPLLPGRESQPRSVGADRVL